MDIMKSTGVDFSGLAEKISSDFLERGTPLADGIVAQAKRLSLKPEEVRRLVEKTNTACSIKVMRSSDDKKKQFELADKNAVLAETHGFDRADANGAADQSKPDSDKTGSGKPCASEKTASAFPVTRDGMQKTAVVGALLSTSPYLLGLPIYIASAQYLGKKSRDIARMSTAIRAQQTQKALTRGTLLVGAPVAAAGGAVAANNLDEMKKRGLRKESSEKTFGTHDVLSAKHEAARLKQEKIAVELSLQKHLDSLCNTYRGRAADFCKEASAYLSAYPKSTAAPYLKAVNAHLGGGSLTKTAGLVDDTTPVMTVFASISDGHRRLVKIARNISEKEAYLAEAATSVAANSII